MSIFRDSTTQKKQNRREKTMKHKTKQTNKNPQKTRKQKPVLSKD